ncbi:hypothetical protein ID866_11616 [Astraeus odoratus]|nr:hypothetical protein ID866_11616 [Astraeus odoratus]
MVSSPPLTPVLTSTPDGYILHMSVVFSWSSKKVENVRCMPDAQSDPATPGCLAGELARANKLNMPSYLLLSPWCTYVALVSGLSTSRMVYVPDDSACTLGGGSCHHETSCFVGMAGVSDPARKSTVTARGV